MDLIHQELNLLLLLSKIQNLLDPSLRTMAPIILKKKERNMTMRMKMVNLNEIIIKIQEDINLLLDKCRAKAKINISQL